MSTLLSRLLTRETRGLRGHKSSSSSSKWYYPKIPDRLVIPIKSLTCTQNSELRNTVLLGFLKDGKHLVGYTAREFEDEDDFSSGFLCTYTLSLWKFDDKTISEHAPLQNVFECYLFETNDEPLAVSGFFNICVTELHENLLCVHGWQRSEGESSEHFVSLVSLPKILNDELQHKFDWSDRCVVTTKFDYQGTSDHGWEVAFVPGKTPALVVNTGGSLAYQRIVVTEDKEGVKLDLEKRVFFHLDKCVTWLMAHNKGGKNNGVLDLDVRLVAVLDGNVFFNLSVLYQNTGAVSSPMSSWMRRSGIFSLCTASGYVDSKRVFVPIPLVPSTNDLFDHMNVSQALSLRNWLNSMPCISHLHRLTNITAINGESLNFLYHPLYPIALRGYPRTNGT